MGKDEVKKKEEDEAVEGKLTEADLLEQQQIEELQGVSDLYVRQGNMLALRLEEIEMEEREVGRQIKIERLKQRAKGGAAVAMKIHNGKQLKTLRILENRLNKLRIANDHSGTRNRLQKEAINQQRRVQVRCREVMFNLRRDVQRTRGASRAMLEHSTEVEEARQENLAQMREVQKANNAEWSDHNTKHMKLATAVKQHNDDMRERRRKGQLFGKMVSSKADALAGADDMDYDRGGLSMEEEMEAKRRLMFANRNIKRTSQDIKTKTKQYSNHQEGFAKMREVALKEGIVVRNNRDLVEYYLERENEAFSLYNYIQGVQRDVKQYEKELQAIQKLREKEHAKMVKRAEEKKKFLAVLERRRDVAALEAQRTAQRLGYAKETLGTTAQHISQIIVSLKCELKTQSTHSLDEDQGFSDQGEDLRLSDIDEYNLMSFLGLIEERMTDIVTDYLAWIKKSSAAKSARGRGPPSPLLPSKETVARLTTQLQENGMPMPPLAMRSSADAQVQASIPDGQIRFNTPRSDGPDGFEPDSSSDEEGGKAPKPLSRKQIKESVLMWAGGQSGRPKGLSKAEKEKYADQLDTMVKHLHLSREDAEAKLAEQLHGGPGPSPSPSPTPSDSRGSDRGRRGRRASRSPPAGEFM